MYRILSVSDNMSDGCWQRLLLEKGGYGVVSASNAAEAKSLVQVAGIDAIVLGTALGVDDRTSLSLLGVTHEIPVVCMCGLRSEPGCPIVHVLPYDASAYLLRVVGELVGAPHSSKTIQSLARYAWVPGFVEDV